jgi:hypothetical protein
VRNGTKTGHGAEGNILIAAAIAPINDEQIALSAVGIRKRAAEVYIPAVLGADGSGREDKIQVCRRVGECDIGQCAETKQTKDKGG